MSDAPATEPRATFASLGERGLIRRLRAVLPSRADVLVGAGDDCAVVAWTAAEDLVLKSDPVREGHHFLPGTDPRRVGRKALGRILSDFAAMGAEPRWALVDLVAPAETPAAAADALYEGLGSLARANGVAVVGGDTSRGDALELHVFCAGAVPRGSAMLRSLARPGDSLWVTGSLGRSFESGRHLDFEPRLREGAWLRARGARACIDVSDGLASELWHLARESGVRIALDPGAVPLSETCGAMPDPLAHALGDGEDFELLFTVPPGDAGFEAAFRRAFPGTRCTRVGAVDEPCAGGHVRCGPEPGAPELPQGGFDHFPASLRGRPTSPSPESSP